MIIRGFIDSSFSPPAPNIKALVSIDRLKVGGFIKLLVDTGASTTAILDRDRELLGISVSELEKAPARISGIGGSVDTYIARGAEMVFKTLDGEHRESLDLLVVKHDLSGLQREEAKRILAIPSLLGRDVIRRFKLIYSEAEDYVALEDRR